MATLALAVSVACSATPLAIRGIYVRIAHVEFMASRTMRLSGIDRGWSVSTQRVLALINHLKVSWIYAARVTAQVVNSQPGKNRADKESVRGAMG